MKAIKNLFKLLNRVLDGAYDVTDEAINWSDELVTESKSARADLARDRQELLPKA